MAAIDKSKFAGKTACVLGASGEVGKQILRTLLQHKVFERVVVIGRRELDFGEDAMYSDVVQRLVDFEALDKHSEAFGGCDVAFCALGTTRAKSGKDGFYKVDHDYVVGAGKTAKEVGVRHFVLCSSKGADASTRLNFYLQTKGKAEEALTDLSFPRLSIFRPGFLQCERPERRIMVPTETVAKGMIYNLFPDKNVGSEIIENAPIHQLAAKFDAAFNP